MRNETKPSAFKPVCLAVKRLMDVFGSIVGLVLFSPLMLFVMWKIKRENDGAVFFRQTRYGRNGEKICVIKFRTMVPNADEILDEMLSSDVGVKKEWDRAYKLKNDPRITKFGVFLRRFSIDEIPQFWNVIRGDMSLVGPRPRPEY